MHVNGVLTGQALRVRPVPLALMKPPEIRVMRSKR